MYVTVSSLDVMLVDVVVRYGEADMAVDALCSASEKVEGNILVNSEFVVVSDQEVVLSDLRPIAVE